MSANMGFLFYKSAYREVERGITETPNGAAIQKMLAQKPTYSEAGKNCFPYPTAADMAIDSLNSTKTPAMASNDITAFRLKVLYPGVYAGLGYTHGLSSENDIKTGFSFDYTTGLPYIPGSSLKGRLRSLFMNQTEDVVDAAKALQIIEADESEEGMKSAKAFVRKLEDKLFGSRNGSDDHDQGLLVCFDVFPLLTMFGRELMKKDYITPHDGDFAPPNPINTAAITPETQLMFLFSLPAQIQVEGCSIAREQISDLFKGLLIDWGIGAKTNTGYGNLAEV